MDKREGVSRFFVEMFSSYNAEIFHSGTILCFRKLLVSKKFLRGMGEDGGVSRFSVESFMYHSSNKFCRETLHVFRKIWCRKLSWIVGGITIFCDTIENTKCKFLLGFEPLPIASELCCPTYWDKGTLEILTIVREIIIFLAHQSFQLGQSAWELRKCLISPHCRDHFLKIRRFEKITLVKKRNGPVIRRKYFSCI